MNHIYPICVIGGGSAGVMSMLRSVLNNDECLFFPGSPENKKKSRAFWVSKIENMPAHFNYRKGIVDPNKEVVEFLLNGPYAHNLIMMKNRGVVNLVKQDSGNFLVTDNKGDQYKARFIILCTGVMDVQPVIGGSIDPILPYANVQLADYCLRCDGHHVLDKHVTIIGNDDSAAWASIILKERYNCPSITILTHDISPSFSNEVQQILDLYEIGVVEGEIIGIKGDAKQEMLEGYTLSSGEFIQTNFTFISLGMIIYNGLAISLEADLDKRGFVLTDSKGLSSVECLYVAGDLRANAKKQVYTAWDHAVDSADAINSVLRQKKRKALLNHH